MNTPQKTIMLSVAALVLAGFSVAMQIPWKTQDPDTGPALAKEPKKSKPDPKTSLLSMSAVMPDSDTPDKKQKDKSAELEEKFAHLEKELDRLKRLIHASGLDVAVPQWGAGMGGAPRPLFEQLGKQAASRARLESRREELGRQVEDIKYSDINRYGPEGYRDLETLYRQARPTRGPATEEDQIQRTKALDKMVQEYPEAYSTSVAIAEQALDQAIQGNTDQVAATLQTLKEVAPYTDIVTDRGMEAMPTIQTYLARQYIKEDRIEDASALLNEIAEKYPDSIVVEPSPLGEPSPQTVDEIVTELRREIGNRPGGSGVQ